MISTSTLSQELLAAVEKINALESSEEDKSLALASLYRANKRNDLAIETLQKIVDSGKQNASFYLTLGSFYELESLNEQAVRYYEEALRTATATNSVEEQIVAKVGLAKVQPTNSRLLQEAQTDFDALPQSTLESKGEEQLKKLISGEQSVNAALLGGCGDCGFNKMWSGFGVSKRCLSCL